MKIQKIITIAMISLASASTSFGINTYTWTDVDIDGHEGQPNWIYMGAGDVFSSDFDIKPDGFQPIAHTVLDATVTFGFSDDWLGDDLGDETVTIVIDGGALWTGLEVDGFHDNSPVNYDFHTTSLSGSLIANLNVDGVLQYSVTVNSGDTYLKEAKLVANGVPDAGSTSLLLSLGLLGISIVSRRLKK